jgi:hypothetical protein
MKDQLGSTSSQNDGSANLPSPQPQNIQPAVVDYVADLLPVDNPHGLKALEHQRIFRVWKVLVDQNGQVLQVLELLSSSVVDVRYLYLN